MAPQGSSVAPEPPRSLSCVVQTCIHHASSGAYEILHTFSGSPSDGRYPQGTLLDLNGTLYGTTPGGGANGYGTVFSITTSGAEKILHSFANGVGAIGPAAGLIDVNGTLYGPTVAGGASNGGSIYSVSTTGKVTVLHSFPVGKNGFGPQPNGLLDVNGTLYGTTQSGGTYNVGLVFSLSTTGKNYRVLHSFVSRSNVCDSDGCFPYSALTDVNGTLYGTTWAGGANGGGTVFSITTNGTEKVLHSFGKGSDGVDPFAGLIDMNGALYGTTSCGGAYSNNACLFGSSGGTGGTVFSITTSGTEKVLHSFGSSKKDGDFPNSPLIDLNGTLYGVTSAGGMYNTGSSHPGGTLFSLSTSGSESVLHSFGNGSDGLEPYYAGLTTVSGTLYGTTVYGGTNDYGTIFSLKP